MSPIEYSVLYLASTVLVGLQETRLLTERRDGNGWFFHRTRAAEYKITEYSTAREVVAVSLDDEHNAKLLGLSQVSLIEGRAPFQQAALAIYRARRSDVEAIFWRSKHREANGLVVALFHEKKVDVGLSRVASTDLLAHAVMDELSRIKVLVFD